MKLCGMYLLGADLSYSLTSHLQTCPAFEIFVVVSRRHIQISLNLFRQAISWPFLRGTVLEPLLGTVVGSLIVTAMGLLRVTAVALRIIVCVLCPNHKTPKRPPGLDTNAVHTGSITTGSSSDHKPS